MNWFDGHLDLTYIADHGKDLRGEGGLTFNSLRAANVTAAVSTLFVRRRTPAVDGPYCFDTLDGAHAAARRQVAMHAAWADAGLTGTADGQLNITLGMEGAACLRTVDDLAEFHAAGVRVVGLAWAEGNQWAGGDQSGGDVTPAGLRLIDHIDTLNCIHDVTHLSEEAFWTLLARAKGKIVASHSNCRALLPGSKHPDRHLSDPQIKALAAKEGLIGVNLFARFLVPPEELTTRRATTADVVRHLDHLAQTAGRRDLLALGSDMESGFGPDLLPEDLQSPHDLPRLAHALSAAGWSDADLHGFMWNNWTRLLRT